MTNIISGLLDSTSWEVIFATAFFFGLFFFLLSIFGSFGDEDSDFGDSDTDLDFEGDLDLDTEFDADFDSEVDLDSDFAVDDELAMGQDTFDTVQIDSFDAEKEEDNPIIESKFKMGEYATFSLFVGIVGWFYSSDLSDLELIMAIVTGVIMARIFGFIISRYTQTVVVPVRRIRRGDIAEVVYSVTPDKSGRVMITRRDGVVSTEMAKGAYPHDNFQKGEKGYIWGLENGIYLITKGISGQPDLNIKNKDKPKKKAMDV